MMILYQGYLDSSITGIHTDLVVGTGIRRQITMIKATVLLFYFCHGYCGRRIGSQSLPIAGGRLGVILGASKGSTTVYPVCSCLTRICQMLRLLSNSLIKGQLIKGSIMTIYIAFLLHQKQNMSKQLDHIMEIGFIFKLNAHVATHRICLYHLSIPRFNMSVITLFR